MTPPPVQPATRPAVWAPWNDVEAAAAHGAPLALSAAQCAALVRWHNDVVGAKNALVRENLELLEKLGKVTSQS